MASVGVTFAKKICGMTTELIGTLCPYYMIQNLFGSLCI